MPVGDPRVPSAAVACGDPLSQSPEDLGGEINLLTRGSYITSGYPQIRFNGNGALDNRWYVVTVFNRDKNLTDYDSGAIEPYNPAGDFHPGEDWNGRLPGDTDSGRPIHAIADGVVLFSSQQFNTETSKRTDKTNGFGNIIVLGHKLSDGKIIASVYAHMQNLSACSVGQRVNKGDIIGTIGDTGLKGTSSHHLHFEIIRTKTDAKAATKVSQVPTPVIDSSTKEIFIRYSEIKNRLGTVTHVRGWYWPGKETVIATNYYDPSQFINDFQPPPPPSPGTWSATKGPLATARTYHTATRLSNGKVLVSGGRPVPFSPNSNPRASAELYDPTIGTWITTDPMNTARSGHSATLLSNGKVLVAGGSGTSGDLALAELYDPATGRWSFTDPMITARSNHAATLLASGKVLVAGGQGGALAELYDPATGTWTATGSLRTARSLHTATLLPNGKVLVAGGCPANSGCSSHVVQAELYDPATGIWSFTGLMVTGRDVHTATLLSNGKVLVTGGYGDTAQLASAELYDPATGEWTNTRSMSISRVVHAAVLLPNGKVLVAGRYDVATAELYDPTTGTWTRTGSMTTVRHHIQDVAVLLGTGQVLVVGGTDSSGGNALASAELYQP